MKGKLGFAEDESGSHIRFVRLHDGEIVGKTHISHGKGKDLSDGVVAAMARQLGVGGPTLRRAIDCSVSGEAFLAELIRASR